MAMELRQNIKMSQQLRMTPQLQQAIKLLQLSRMELITAVRQEMVENPVLEELPDTDNYEPIEAFDAPMEMRSAADRVEEVPQGERDAKEKIDWEKFLENYSAPTPGNSYQGLNDERPGLEQTLSTSESLTEHLMEQVRLSGMSEDEEYLATLIIGNLDEYGYLRAATVEDIAEDAEASVDDVEFILTEIQRFDPLGVGARDLQECLLIQVDRLFPEDEIVRRIILEHIPNLERKSYQKIAKALDCDMDAVIAAAKRISHLEPKPGREFADYEARYITPDIYIYKIGDDYVPVLNEDGMPKLRISGYYRKELARQKEGKNNEVKDYIQDKLRGAMWLIRSIHQRQNTIMKVTESIIKFQRDFFDYGVEHLKPLVLRDVAEDIDMHESTVSRVTTNKYVHTPRGTFELKYFFNSSITNLDGDDLASEAVKAKIREIVAQENPKKPMSDAKIVEILAKEGIDIARRTVAKYREAMGILSSAKRKELF
ncbi:MAG: RNA polymerase factor sigma-54 [bacterium]